MSSVIDASSRVRSVTAGCDMVTCGVGFASFVPGLITRVVRGLAFHPPKPPGYHVTPERRVLLVRPKCELIPLPDLSSEGIRVDVVRMWTRRMNSVHAFHFKRADAHGTLLFSHGNGTDIGNMYEYLCDLCRELGSDIFAYDYSGYGESSGVPSEADLCADIDAAYQYLTMDLDAPCSTIFLYGQSIGSVPALDLASRKDVGGVILQSALKSGLSLVHNVQTTFWFDVFKNIEKIRHVRAPVFVMHGTLDTEVPLDHGMDLHAACPPEWAFEPWWAEYAGHNDIDMVHRDAYLAKLRGFIQTCLAVHRKFGHQGIDEDSEHCERDYAYQWQPP
mmetsp:Transcript_2124/g.5233  ORF Transcript_2124/g.5233 Transcript_2124/m.5233 type:complete len:333 (+) Transcript_2124:94-1092(+)